MYENAHPWGRPQFKTPSFCRGRILELVILAMFTFQARTAIAENAEDLFKQACTAYEFRQEPAKAKRAVDLYEKAIEAGAGYQALWEGSRSIWFLAEFHSGDKSRRYRTALFDRGRSWAKQATKLRPNGVEGIFWHGVTTGAWAGSRGIFRSLRMRHVVRQAGEDTLRIDVNVECGGPYRLLGRYYHKVPGSFGGDPDKAINLLQKAIDTCPQNELGRIYMAEVLIDEDRNSEARQQLEKIIDGPTDPRFLPEHGFLVNRAKALLSDL